MPFLPATTRKMVCSQQMQSDGTIVEDGPDPHAKGFTAVVALPDTLAGDLTLKLPDPIQRAEARADRLAVRPDARLDIGNRGVFIVELSGIQNRAGHDVFSSEALGTSS